MFRKKTKRINSRKIIEGQWAAQRRWFIESGTLSLILLLLVFTLISSFVLSIGVNPDEQERFWHKFGWEAFFVNGSLMLILSAALGLYIAANEKEVVKNYLQSSLLLGMLKLE